MKQKFPITIHPLFWVFGLLIGWLYTQTFMGAMLWLIAITFSLLFHEAGHALTAKAFGQKIHIHLSFFGGTTVRDGPKLSLFKEFLIVLAGPVAGIILFLISYFLIKSQLLTSRETNQIFLILFQINLIWTVLNLVPVGPLDGGRLLSIILEAIFGARGVKAAIYIGMIIGTLVAIVAFLKQEFYIGLLFVLLTMESSRSLRYAKMMTDQDRTGRMQNLYSQAQNSYRSGNIDEAIRLFETIRSQNKIGLLFVSATEALAQIYYEKNDLELAYQYLSEIKDNLSTSVKPLYHELATHFRDYSEVVRWGHQVYQITPTPQVAFNNAVAHAAIGEVEAAIGWLECAKHEGMLNINELLEQSAFDRIRKTSEFQNFQQNLK